MPKVAKHGYYAVRIGRVPGIYRTWDECEAHVKGFQGAVFKKLSTEAEANQFMAAKSSTARTSIVPGTPTTRAPITPDLKTPPSHSEAKDPIDCDTVYCDGACRGNGQPGSVAGIGVWWGHGDPRNISERCPGDQTNNRAELIAIVRILETIPRLKRRLVIKTDSNYSIQCITVWVSNWMRNGFLTSDGKPVKNRALIKYLAALLHARRKTSQSVEFKHVRGHVGIEGNEAADQLANLGATMPVVPERDWEKLEKQVSQSLKPVKPIKVVDDDLKVYAAGLLDNDELAELVDSSIPNVIPSESRPPYSGNGNDVTERRTTVSQVQVPPPRPKATMEGNRITTLHSKGILPSGGSSGPTAVAAGLGSAPANEPTTSMSKEELERMFASCLLDDDELSTLGKDGVFDSDF